MRRRGPLLAVLFLLAFVLAGATLEALPAPADTGNLTAIQATVSNTPGPQAMAPGFEGVSVEFSAIRAYTGSDPRHIDPVLVQLLRALAPGASPVIRIGGNSTDRTWWPVRGMKAPPGIEYALTPSWMQTTAALARAVKARLIVGVNLAADEPALAAAEARAFEHGLGRSIAAFEIGNEPDVYSQFPWSVGHLSYYPRPSDYDLSLYSQDFSRFAAALPPAPLAGPAFAEMTWLSGLGQFIAAQPKLGLVTVHRYPLRACINVPIEPGFASIPSLLNDDASAGMAQMIAPYVKVTHDAGLPFRVGEMNSASCSGKRGVSNTFAASLWVLDTLFNLASVGVDGVNLHTLPKAPYELWTFSHTRRGWSAFVHPEYYGMLMFAQAFPAGARLLPVSAPDGPLKIWATLGADGHTRVVLINKSTTAPASAVVQVPGATGTASLEWLRAPSVSATSGVTLGGQTFGTSTRTGVLAAPHTTPIAAAAGAYSISVPPASAVLLTQ